MPSVLALGLDPAFADFAQFPPLAPDLIGSFIDSQLVRLRELRYEVESCLVDLGKTAEAVATQALNSRSFDRVMIGASIRAPAQLLLFEKRIKLARVKVTRWNGSLSGFAMRRHG